MDERALSLNAADARRLVLAQAIDEADGEGRLIGAAERDGIEHEALQESRLPGSLQLDRGKYLLARARRVLSLVEARQPRVASLQEPEPWRAWVAWGLPMAACVFGAAIDRIDNPRQVNMLSPPLLAVIFWNLFMYAWLALALLRPRGDKGGGPWARLQHWLEASSRRSVRGGVASRFRVLWLELTGAGEAAWWRQVLHATAAAWGVGLGLSIVLGGLVREYRVGWESTLLDLPQVHAFLGALFAPVVALLPFDAFTMAEVQRMHFASGADIGVQEARRWIWLYLGLLGVAVVLPRAVLAALAFSRARLAARNVRIDLARPYFADVLSRVSPARVTLGLLATEPLRRDAVLRVLRQASDQPAMQASMAPGEWTMLTTIREDELRVVEVMDAAVPASNGADDKPRGWLQDMLQGRSAPAGRPSPLQRAKVDCDVLVTDAPGHPVAAWLAKPTVALEPLDDFTANWTHDPNLQQAIAAQLPAGKAAGFARITTAWNERNEARFAEAMRLLAQELLQAAREVEEVQGSPLSLRHLVSSSDRDAGQRARQAAIEALVERVRTTEVQMMLQLLRLHGIDLPAGTAIAQQHIDHRKLLVQQAVDSPQAATAGAATGAAMGAGIDLMTGGLTLGAAAALGALVGAAAAFTAAHWKNRAAPSGAAQVQLGEELLDGVTEAVLLRYLAVIHWGRSPEAQDFIAQPRWRSEVVAEVEASREALHVLWTTAHEATADAQDLQRRIAIVLEKIALTVLDRLRAG